MEHLSRWQDDIRVEIPVDAGSADDSGRVAAAAMAHLMVESGGWLSSVEPRRQRRWECDDLLWKLDTCVHQELCNIIIAPVHRHLQ